MIYIVQDLRNKNITGEIITYHQMVSRKKAPRNVLDLDGFWCTLKIWDDLSNKYKKQRVWLTPVYIENFVVKHAYNISPYTMKGREL